MTWVYLSLDSTRGAQLSSPSPLFFHVILLPLDFCGVNAGYTHITELGLPWGSEASTRCVPNSFLVVGVSEGGQNWQSKPMFSQAVTPWLRRERWLLSSLFLHQPSGSPIPFHSSCTRISYFCSSPPWSAIATTDGIFWTCKPGLIPEFAPSPVRIPFNDKEENASQR